MAENDTDMPESGEDQYLQWVGQVQSASRLEGAQPSAGSGTDSEESQSKSQSHGADTLVVAIPSVFPRPLVTTSRDLISVAAGQPVRVKVTVRNVGPVVESYALSIVGTGHSWANIIPQDISLFPGDEGVATIVIKPPRAYKVLAGEYTIGIRARSEVDPNESSVHEFVVQVKPFYESTVSLSRTTIDIKGRTTTYGQVTNSGNSDVEYTLAAIDPDGYARCQIEDPSFTLAAGETAWKRISIRAPRHIIGKPRTLGLVGTLTPIRDASFDEPLPEIKPLVQRATLIQKALIRFRLGPLSKVLLVLLVLGIVAAFILSRYLLGPSNEIKSGPPATPADLSASAYQERQVQLRWEASGGATGYSIYAVGDSGNALSETLSPSAPAASQTPSPSKSATTNAVSSSGVLQFEFVSFPVTTGGEAPSNPPSPGASSPSDNSDPSTLDSPDPSGGPVAPELDIESPACGDCTHVADVASGTTRHIVTKVKLGATNCYRIVATNGQTQSLYTPQRCVDIPAASAALASDADAAKAPSPCPPKAPRLDKISDTVLALTWLMPSETKKKAAKKIGCDREATLSGYEVQRQILSGWSTWKPAPAATDTALEITELQPATPYCFRMRSASKGQNSKYTENICKKTKRGPATPTETSPAAIDGGVANNGLGSAETTGGTTLPEPRGQNLRPKNSGATPDSVKNPKIPSKANSVKNPKPNANKVSRIVVKRGEALWLIADKFSPKSETTEQTVMRIMKLNNLKSQIIWPGQVLKIPK